MTLRLSNPFRRKPMTVITVFKAQQNCFCGAAFAIEIPILSWPNSDREHEYLVDYDAAREQWYQSHYHQTNMQLGPVVDFTDNVEALADAVRPGVGFQLPH